MEKKFDNYTFEKRIKTMLKVDFKRMFTMPFVFIMIAIALLAPVLILVMTQMMDGTISVNPQTGAQTVIEGFDNVWQILGSVSSQSSKMDSASMEMGLTTMCNINMLYFAVAVLVCVFVSADFKSGYVKNLFTVRSMKTDYVISKTIVCFVGSALMFIAFFIGALIGGKVSGVPFDRVGFTIGNLLDFITSKIFLTLIFVAIYVLASVIAKSKTWLSILISLMIGMLLFNIAPMVSPLDSNFMHVFISLVAGVAFSVGLGAISNVVLKKTSLI